MPELWANIVIDDRLQEYPMDSMHLIRVAHKVLLRSGDASLSFQVHIAHNMKDTSPLVDLVTIHSRRIRYLELYLSNRVLSDILCLHSLPFSSLELLSLHGFGPAIQDSRSVGFQHMPNLRVVELGINFKQNLAMPQLPWSQLTALFLMTSNSASLSMVNRALQACLCLEALQISLRFGNAQIETRDTTPEITIPYLKVLLVTSLGCADVAAFLQPLILPRLTHLELRGFQWINDSSSWDLSTIAAIVAGYHLVKTLKLDYLIPTDGGLNTFLKSIPNLHHLTLPMETPLSILTLSLISSGALLLKLHTLESLSTVDSLEEYLKMLNNRADTGFSIQGLILPDSYMDLLIYRDSYAHGQYDEKFLLRKLIEKGLLRKHPPQPLATELKDFIDPRMLPVSWYAIPL
jgi:hypothetical protein